jgi:hypothetical protein
MNYFSISNRTKKRGKILQTRVYIILFIFFSISLHLQLKAQGNINISPSRIVFEGQKKIMELILTNDGQDSAKYSISFVQIRMTEDGVFQNITNPDLGQNFADKYVRIYPRSVRMGPNKTQVVRLQLTNTDKLVTGEYRSHLYFKSLIPQKALTSSDIRKDSSVLIDIQATFGITVPVIIRVGESTTKMNISDLKIETLTDGTHKLHLTLNRTGNMSVYGDISVMHIALNGKENKIGLIKGVAVYTPNNILRIITNLESNNSVDMKKGKLLVTYSSKSETRPEKFAESELVL